MGGEDDDFLFKKSVLRFREALEGDDFAESLLGRVEFGGETGHGLVELSSEGGFFVILCVVAGEDRSWGG